MTWDVTLNNKGYMLFTDAEGRMAFRRQTQPIAEIGRFATGTAVLGRRVRQILAENTYAGAGDSRANPLQGPGRYHRTLNTDGSNGYIVPSPTFRRLNATARDGNPVRAIEITANNQPAILYFVDKRAIRVDPGGAVTVEKTWAYNVTDAIAFDGTVYIAFGTNDNIWRRDPNPTGGAGTYLRQAGTTTSITEEAVPTSGDDAEETLAAAFSLTDTTIRVGRLSNASLTVNVAASADDAHEGPSITNVTAATVPMTEGPWTYMGLRFLNITIPQGTTIVSAKLTIELNGAATGGNITIWGQLATNPSTFVAGGTDISTRAHTTASATWTVPAGGVAGDRIDTSSLVSLMQEIVNQGGFASGNAVVFLLYTNVATVATFRTYDNAVADAATLTITYADTSKIGARFTTVPIAQGAIIDTASLKLMPSASKASGPKMRIRGVAANNPAIFSSTNKPSQQALTTAYIDWTPGDLTVDTDVTSADITTIVQEIVNRSGFASNNAVAFVLDNHADNAASTFHTFYAQDHVTGTEIRFNCTYRTSNQSSIKASYFAIVAGDLHRAYDGNKISKCLAGTSPFDSASWSAPSSATTTGYNYAGTNDWSINALVGLDAAVLPIKADGIYQFNETLGIFTNKIPFAPHPDNGLGTHEWKNAIWVPLASGRIIYYNGYQVEDAGPLKAALPSTSTAFAGRVRYLTHDEEWLYAATDVFHTKTQVNIRIQTTTDGSTYTNQTTNLTDADPTTTVTFNLDTLANNDWAVVAHLNRKIHGIYLDIGTANTSVASVTAQYWNGTTWSALSTVYDNTDVNGVALAQSGAIYWDTMPTDWAQSTINSITGYWVRLSWSSVLLSTTTVREVYGILAEDNLPSGAYSSYTGMDTAGLMPHILKGRLARPEDNTPSLMVWHDVWAMLHGPITAMYLIQPSMGMHLNGGQQLITFSRREINSVSLPLVQPSQRVQYVAKNSDSNDSNKTSNIFYSSATAFGAEGSEKIVHQIQVQTRNFEPDDVLELWARSDAARATSQESTWMKLGISTGTIENLHTFLVTGLHGRWIETAIGLRDNDPDAPEPVHIVLVTADATIIPEEVETYEFMVKLQDWVTDRTGAPDYTRTAQETWNDLLEASRSTTPLFLLLPDGSSAKVLVMEIRESYEKRDADSTPIRAASITAIGV